VSVQVLMSLMDEDGFAQLSEEDLGRLSRALVDAIHSDPSIKSRLMEAIESELSASSHAS
jgi:hypothetical protein